MSLDITIKQGKRNVYSNNFYGFIHFNKENRHQLSNDMQPESVVDYETYKTFIEKAVEPDRQYFYLKLVDITKPITVIIW